MKKVISFICSLAVVFSTLSILSAPIMSSADDTIKTASYAEEKTLVDYDYSDVNKTATGSTAYTDFYTDVLPAADPDDGTNYTVRIKKSAADYHFIYLGAKYGYAASGMTNQQTNESQAIQVEKGKTYHISFDYKIVQSDGYSAHNSHEIGLCTVTGPTTAVRNNDGSYGTLKTYANNKVLFNNTTSVATNGWKTCTTEYTVAEDADLSGGAFLAIYSRFLTWYMTIYIDNVTVKTCELSGGEVLSENDYSTALTTATPWQMGGSSGNAYPKADPLDENNVAMYYRQSNYRYGAVFLGSPFTTNNATTIKSQTHTAEAGATYRIEFDYYATGTPTSNVPVTFAVGDNTGTQGAIKFAFSYTKATDIVFAKDTAISMDGWVRNKAVTVTVPSDTDFTNGSYMMLLCEYGGTSGLQLYFDNITVSKITSVRSIPTEDAVIIENDFNNATAFSNQYSTGNSMNDAYPTVDPLNDDNKVVRYAQSQGFGIIPLGNNAFTSNNSISNGAVSAEAGTSYRIDFDYYLKDKTTSSNLIVYFGVAKSANNFIDANSFTYSYASQVLNFDKDAEITMLGYQSASGVLTVPENADFTNGDKLVLYGWRGNGKLIYFDNIKVTRLAGAAVRYEIDGKETYTYSSTGTPEYYNPTEDENKTAVWYSDKAFTQEFDFDNYTKSGKFTTLNLYGDWHNIFEVKYYLNLFEANNTASFDGISVSYDENAVTDDTLLPSWETLFAEHYTDTSVYENLEFDGWYTLGASGNARTFAKRITSVKEAIDAGCAVYAKWNYKNNVTKTYNVNEIYSNNLHNPTYSVEQLDGEYRIKYSAATHNTSKNNIIIADTNSNAGFPTYISSNSYAKLNLGTSYEVRFKYRITEVADNSFINIFLSSAPVSQYWNDSYKYQQISVVKTDDITDGWVEAKAYFTVDTMATTLAAAGGNADLLSAGAFSDALSFMVYGGGTAYIDDITVTAMTDSAYNSVFGADKLTFTADGEDNGLVTFDEVGAVAYDKSASKITLDIGDLQPHINAFNLNGNRVYKNPDLADRTFVGADSGKEYIAEFADGENTVEIVLFDKNDAMSGSNFSMVLAEEKEDGLRFLARAYSPYGDYLWHNGTEYTVAERGVLVKRTQKAFAELVHNDMLVDSIGINKVPCEAEAFNKTGEFYDYSVAINGISEKYADTLLYVRGYMVLSNGSDSFTVYTDNILAATPSTVTDGTTELAASYVSDSSLSSNGIESVTLSIYESGEDTMTYGLAWIMQPEVKEDIEPADTVETFVEYIETYDDVADFTDCTQNIGTAAAYRVRYMENDEDYYNDSISASAYDAKGKFYYVRSGKTTMELERGKTYKYRVGFVKDGERNYSRVGTVNVPSVEQASDGSFNFLYMSDIQYYTTTDNVWGKTLSLATENFAPEFMVLGGDIVQWSGYERQWSDVLDVNSHTVMNIPQIAVAGNHEYNMFSNTAYYAVDMHFNFNVPEGSDTQSGVYYSYDYENTHFVVLNSNEAYHNTGIGAAQYAWLAADLAAAKARKDSGDIKNIIVSTHFSLYGFNAEIGGMAQSLDMRAQLQGLFAENAVDLVLQAHDHRYSRTHALDGEGNVAQQSNDNTYTKNAGVVYITTFPAGTQTNPTTATNMGENDSKYATYMFGDWGTGAYSWTEIEVNGGDITVSSYTGSPGAQREKGLVDTFTIIA